MILLMQLLTFAPFLRYLKVEMSNPIYEARYREVFSSFQDTLSLVFVNGGSITSTSNKAPDDSAISLWELLTHQERFISGIMDCQKASLVVRGKKDAKETNLREALESFKSIPHAVPLPSAPHIFV